MTDGTYKSRLLRPHTFCFGQEGLFIAICVPVFIFPSLVARIKAESKSADSLIWEGVGRDGGGEIVVVVIVRAVVTPVVWGRGMCVTMWREKALAKGDACCWSSVSCFLRKPTRVALWTCLR